jgi:hypothetical protein
MLEHRRLVETTSCRIGPVLHNRRGLEAGPHSSGSALLAEIAAARPQRSCSIEARA